MSAVRRLRCYFHACGEVVFVGDWCTGHYSQLLRGVKLAPLRPRYAAAPFRVEDGELPVEVPRTTDPTAYAASLPTYRHLMSIHGLEERLVEAHLIAEPTNTHSEVMAEIRARRAYGAQVLRFVHGWRAATIISRAGVTDRRHIEDALQGDYAVVGPRPEMLPVAEETAEWALEVVVAAQADYRGQQAIGRTARAVRQDLVRAMANTLWSPADLAELLDMSRAGVSQIQHGTGNGKKKDPLPVKSKRVG